MQTTNKTLFQLINTILNDLQFRVFFAFNYYNVFEMIILGLFVIEYTKYIINFDVIHDNFVRIWSVNLVFKKIPTQNFPFS